MPSQDKTKRSAWLYLLFLIGFCTLTARAAFSYDFAHTGLFYIGFPYVIALAIHFLVPRSSKTTTTGSYFNTVRDATVVMLATSAILFEGFLCVLMFMPIFYFVVFLAFITSVLLEREPKKSGLKSYVLPVIVLALSMEGVLPTTTAPRQNEVTETVIVDTDIAALKANMARPITFDEEREWFVSIFPMPTKVTAGSLEAGDIHTLNFVYKRWFFTNTHEGEMRLRIDAVGADFVRTSIIENTSYLANYLKITGTEVRFSETDDARTKVSLNIRYTRLLDPVWYFGPMQRLAVQQSARYLLETVITRQPLG